MSIPIYSTVLNPDFFDFPHELNVRHNQQDKKWSARLKGFLEYFLENHREKWTQTHQNIVNHMLRTQHHFNINLEKNDLYAVAKWGWKHNCIIVMPDSTICDPSGFVLAHPKNEIQSEEALMPYTKASIERREKTNIFLRKQGVINSDHYPPVVSECEVLPRTAADTTKRALAFFTVALRAEILSKEKGYQITKKEPSPAVKLKQAELKKELSIAGLEQSSPSTLKELRAEEKEFLSNVNNATEQQVIDFMWHYEALNILLWGLSLIDDLPYPSKQCNNVPELVKIMLLVDENYIANRAKLKPIKKLLDSLDFHFSLYRLSIDNPKLNGIDRGVLKERFEALSWLLQFHVT
jgi:hypothetical protein